MIKDIDEFLLARKTANSGGEGGGGSVTPLLYFLEPTDPTYYADWIARAPEINNYNHEYFSYDNGIFTVKKAVKVMANVGVAEYNNAQRAGQISLFVNDENKLTVFASSNNIGGWGVEIIMIDFNIGDTFYLRKVDDTGWASPQLMLIEEKDIINFNIGDISALKNTGGATETFNAMRFYNIQ